MVQLFAKKDTDTHNKLPLNHEDRENNVIVFNVSETNKDDDNKTFNQMCTQWFRFVDAPKVSMTKLRAKNRQKQLKV